MKKLILSSLAASTLMFTTANAGVILDFEVGAGAWMTETSGDINYQGGNIDVEKDLGLSDSTNPYFYADFNHFVPLLPNVRIERQVLTTDAKKATNITFANIDFDTTTATDLDLSQNDLILYWGIPGLNILSAGILNVDFGIDIKQFDGSISLQNEDASKKESLDLDFVIPMGYLAVQVKPPFMPVKLSASTKVISYDGSSFNDSMIKASIKLPIRLPLIDFKIDLCYKSQKLDISDSLSNDINGNITNSGFTAGISAKF